MGVEPKSSAPTAAWQSSPAASKGRTGPGLLPSGNLEPLKFMQYPGTIHWPRNPPYHEWRDAAELVARVLEYDKDPRKVVVDPDARYSGVKLSENSLIPGKDAKLGSTKFGWWLVNVAPPPKK